MNRNLINITKNAWNKINYIVKNTNEKQGMLFSVQGGGCNGFNYKLDIIKNDIDIKKFSFVQDKNIKVYVEPMSEIYLIGTTIDYINEDFNKGVYESKFKFIPDKDKGSTCGCGVSFSPKF
ncbi:iron-sulfur cluster assembly accessory protein [bacterium]|nr:iron-sulfur cluster assembly accessory protein [bacterium]